jgi:hypothetical protein
MEQGVKVDAWARLWRWLLTPGTDKSGASPSRPTPRTRKVTSDDYPKSS